MIFPNDYLNKIICGDCMDILKAMPDESVNCCITSPPYWGLRDYGVDGQLGLEKTPEEYVAHMVEVFREVRRILRKDGTCWLNLGDSYAHSLRQSGPEHAGKLANASKGQIKQGFKPLPSGLKEKDLVGIPWRVAFALQADGWYLRQDIIWHKPNPMPESVTDRCTKAHEYVFLLSKQAKYYYDADAIKEQSIDPESFTGRRERNAGNMELTDPDNYKFHGSIGEDGKLKSGQKYETRNRRSVWTVTTKPFREAHFATFPPDLIEPCALAGCSEGGAILDPFMGAGTTAVVAKQNYRNYIGIELNEKYIEIARKRIAATLVNKKLEFGGET